MELQCGQCPWAIERATPSCERSVVIEFATWRCARWAAPRDVIFKNGRQLALNEVFFTPSIAASLEWLCHQKAVCRNAQSSVVMETPPSPSLIVTQSQVRLQVLVIALDAPARVRVCAAPTRSFNALVGGKMDK